jgi:hypothetical protein
MAMELNMRKCFLELTRANSVAKRKVRAVMQYEVQTVQAKILLKFGFLPTSQQTQGWESKEGEDKEDVISNL